MNKKEKTLKRNKYMHKQYSELPFAIPPTPCRRRLFLMVGNRCFQVYWLRFGVEDI
jgi:hypothetical protein